MEQKNYELSICVNGRPIREYGHKGLTFVEGRQGQPYSIKFRNNTAARVMAVVSIDGIDVVDGKPATNESRGYIVPGYQSVEIKGWRTSKKKVNDFVFDNKPRAYSTQTQGGNDTNCGIVAVKVFGEDLTDSLNEFLSKLQPKEHHHHHHHHHHDYPYVWPSWRPTIYWCGTSGGVGGTGTGPGDITYSASITTSGLNGQVTSKSFNCDASVLRSCSNSSEPTVVANLMCAASPAPAQEVPDFNLGTGWGKERIDEVEEVKFKKASELAELTLYYSDEEGLRKAGIEVDKKPAVSKPTLPKAFHGFCTPPAVTS